MSKSTLVPKNPVYTTWSDVAAGKGSAFRADLNDELEARVNELRATQAWSEMIVAQFGNGAISGGTITTVSGLTVTVAAFEAIVGEYIKNTASQSVSVSDAATNELYLRQDGEWTVYPGVPRPTVTTDHGEWLLWGTATTSGGAVTSISNVRATWRGLLLDIVSAGKEAAPTNSEVLLRYVAPRSMAIKAGMSDSQIVAGTAATGSSTFTLKKNGSSFATANIGASGTTATWTAASDTAFVKGDILTVEAPSSADATLAKIAITLVARY